MSEKHSQQIHHETRKPKHTFLKIGALMFIVAILALGYLGFIPILSPLIGANKPKDLGIKATEADFASASAKLGRSRESLPVGNTPEQSLKFSGSHNVNAIFTSEEVTATMQSRDYKYNPIGKNFQAKFSDDGTVEMSGTLQLQNFIEYGKAARIPDDQVDAVMDKASLVLVNPSFYVKGEGKVVNNRLTYDVEKIEIGKFSIPVSLFPENKISNFVEDRIDAIPGLNVDSLTIEKEGLSFKGTYPDKSYYLKE
ncbi:MAG: hypothetical protein V1859_09135 [archaeon]